ncbi:putative transcription factor C3H family [Lupinus albus]|uniref:Putative transcription factor C3H family n=1 Tax=Lupinus albus TaxID=3870 RepID=A0A6A4NIH0_LUPAL|nr:putative transcription factor C3H family [Lupinus albus]
MLIMSAIIICHVLFSYTDEEVERCYEEFYEDVHTEFLKFGEIVNFKVCKNGAFHLRGNVYVQYKSLDSALLAYNSVNGRYFAGKQISCNFVNLTRWKVAICGEYMRSGFKTCSHGTACNFIHCFRNPGGDYEWADLDKPPPKYWVKNMAALFGYSDNYDNSREREILSVIKKSSKMSETDSDRYHSIRSRSREMVHLNSGRSGRRKYEDETRQGTLDEERNTNLKDSYKMKRRIPDTDSDSDREWLEEEGNREKQHKHVRKSSFNIKNDDNSRSYENDSDTGWANIPRDTEKQHDREGRNSRKSYGDDRDWIYEVGSDGDRDGKRHRSSKRKSSRHESSRDNSNVTSEGESNKDSFHSRDMETQYGYSRKSWRYRRSGGHHESENEEVDGSWSRRESSRRAHHHKKKSSKHQKKLDSINGDTKNICEDNSGE